MSDTSSTSGSSARRLALTGAVVAALLGSSVAVGPTAAGAESRSTRFENALVERLNQARAEQGVAPVKVVPCVDAVAEDKAAAMRRTHRLARVTAAFMRAECSRSLKLSAAAIGSPRPEALLRTWTADGAVRDIVLGRRVRAVGVGATYSRSGGWHVSLLLVGRRLGGGDGGSVPVEEAAPTPEPVDPVVLQGAILAETNQRRENHELPPLEPSTCATDFAVAHSTWMASNDELAHADLDALREECAVPGAAENVAAAQGESLDVEAVVQAWMDSADHRANILDPDLTHLGVGVVHDADAGRWYTTQDFLDAG
jgi:uncharacterized protein YkwD